MIRRIALGVLLSSTWSIAMADFVVLPPNAQKPVPQPSALAAPKLGGPPPLGIAAVAPASTLRDTLRKIVPTGWKAFSDRKVNAEAPVEYMPSADWQQSLATLSTRYNLVFKVDQEKKTVYVDQGPGGMRDTVADNKNLAANNFGQEKAPVTMTADGKLRFEVKAGQRLSDAVRQFLQAGKWDMAWAAGSDVVLEKGFTVTEKDLSTVLTKTLSRFNMHAVLHKDNFVAEIKSNSAE